TNYLGSEDGLAAIAPEYDLAHLLVPVTGGSSAVRRQELTDLLYKQLQKGPDILALAAAVLVDGIRLERGDPGCRKPENLASLFAPIVPALSPGDVAEPFTSSSGHHLVQLLETRGGTERSVEQAHVRHIFIQPTEIRTEER